jgi:hypothetical protein
MAKTIASELVTLQQVNANTNLISSILSVPNDIFATVFIDFAPLTTNAPSLGTEFRIELSQQATGNSTWRAVPGGTFRTGTTAATTFTTGTEAAGSTVIETNPTPAWNVNDVIFFKNATLALGEWARVANIVTNVSVDIVDGITNSQNAAPVFDKAEQFIAVVDMTSATRLRVACANNLHTNSYNIAVRVAAITGR